MQLVSLTITDFKNIPEAHIELSPRFNGFLGLNGMGKSNLLDAIYALSFTKSFTGAHDRMLVRRGSELFMVKGTYLRQGQPEEVTLGYSAGRRKSLKRKGKEYKRMSEHIGSFPIVMMSPRDIDLIRGTGTDRRRWMDMVISQSDATYLDALMRYNAALEQRNRQLRDGVYDRTLLEINEMMMAAAAETIHSARAVFVAELGEIFSRYHRLMAGDDEEVTLTYESELNEPGMTMERLFELNRAKDGIIKHTSSGIHRDDIIMTLGGMDVRRTASEGQCKTFTIALRLAQYEFLSGATHLRPLLLLDDIFDKLDSVRVERIIRMVSGDRFGQIFITDTNRKHLDEIFSATSEDVRLWSVDNGEFAPLELGQSPSEP